MASITNNKADVVITSKVHSSDDLVARRDIHGIVHIVTELAGSGLRSKGITCLIGKICLHHR